MVCSGRLAEEGIDGSQQCVLIAFGQLLERLHASGDASAGGRGVVGGLLEPDQFVGGDAQGLGELGEEFGVCPELAAFDVGDDGLGGILKKCREPFSSSPPRSLDE